MISNIIGIVIIIVCVLYIIRLEYLLRTGKLKRADSYSFTPVIRVFLVGLLISLIISGGVYYFTKDTFVAFSLAAFCIACVLAGTIKGLLFEYQIKRRGGIKEKMRKP